MDAIKLRRSIRKYDLTKKVPYDTLVELCKYASYAPTARRQIDKEYIIVDDENVINKMKELPHGTLKYEDCNTYIVMVAKDPKKLFVPGMEPIDLGMASENLMVKACELGFGTCYLGVYPNEERMKSFNQLFKLTDGDFVFGVIAIGYPLEENKEWDKFDPKTIHHNKY